MDTLLATCLICLDLDLWNLFVCRSSSLRSLLHVLALKEGHKFKGLSLIVFNDVSLLV